MTRREKPVSSSKRRFEVNWSLIGYLLGGLVIIAGVLYLFWLVIEGLF